ncbi:MAG TPA: tripartite tricarboxylate transporter substrate binding protein [Burkholderiales bacterium]|jgi:tripartite-type tricarboxylate transporter receptor subunit TctC|nr:tripartite tricarboxylate transporter substrate binding protein [Burkholderiales bacterium]
MIRILSALTLLLLWSPVPSWAENYPSKPIKLVIAFAAGSATDSAGRILAQELSQRLGQNVIVENRAGANGQLAAVFVARSTADGHTLFMTTNSTHGANPHLYKKLAYDPIKDFAPIARIGTLPFMLVVNPALPANNTAEFIAYAQAHRGGLSYGTASTASLVGAETINHLAGLDLVRVGYSSSPQAILDLVAGRLQVMVADFTTAMPHVKAGKLRVLGVTTVKRTALLPDVPPIAQTLAGFDITSWNGIFAPAGTPREILARLEREILDILSRQEIRKRFAAIGFEIDPMNTVEFSRYVREQIAYWGKLVRDAEIPAE